MSGLMKSGSKLTLGLVQMAMEEDADANVSKALSMVEDAAARGASIVCLPELFSTRYFPQERRAPASPEAIPGPTSRRLSEAAKKSRVTLVGGSIYEKAGRRLFNTSLVFSETGRLLGKYRKVQIPEDESFYEKDYFSAGDGYAVVKATAARVGVLICFDQWYPEPARIERLMGAEVIFYPTAIGRVDGIEEAEGDWKEAWETVQRGHAISNSVVVAAVNRVGREGRMTFWGGSFVSDQFGRVIARADDKEEVLLATCDLALGKMVEAGWGFMKNRRPSTYRRIAS